MSTKMKKAIEVIKYEPPLSSNSKGGIYYVDIKATLWLNTLIVNYLMKSNRNNKYEKLSYIISK